MATDATTDDFSGDVTTAGRLIPGAGPIDGCLEPGSVDRDWFALEVTEGGVYRVDVAAMINGAWDLILRDGDGNVIPTPLWDATTSEDFLSFQADYTGTVFVEVRGASFRGSTPGNGDYTISARMLEEDDAGNSLADAVNLATDSQFDGNISFFGDTDFFVLDILAGETYGLLFDAADALNTSFSVTIYDQDGNVFDSTAGTGIGQDYTAEYTGQAFISIETIGNQAFGPFQSTREDDIGEYSLTVNSEPNGFNFVNGSDANNRIEGSFNSEDIFAGAGGDIIAGSGGNDYIDGGDGADRVTYLQFTSGVTVYADGREPFEAPDGDILVNIETLETTNFDDIVIVAGGDPLNISSYGGNDRIVTSADTRINVSAGQGDDFVRASDLDDSISADGGNDTIFGRDGDDFLRGGDGDDLLYGQGGDDIAFGGAGEDRLFGGDGNDTLNGGDGSDFIRGGNGDDEITGDNQIPGTSGVSYNDRLYGDAGNDTISGGTGDDFLSGGTGADNLDGGVGDDRLSGGEGNDVLVGGSGSDILNGGAGDDRIFGELENLENLTSGSANDRLIGGAGNDYLAGQIGNDVLSGGTGEDYLDGGANDDRLFGGDGNDILFGDSGSDRLWGGDGDDVLIGDSTDGIRAFGNDILVGGTGADTFVFNQTTQDVFSHTDRIVDFNSGEGDSVDISEFGLVSFDQLQSVMSQVNNHVRIDFGEGNVLVMLNTDINSLSAADFGLEEAPSFIEGTDGNDTLTGSNINNVFFGGSGDDIINGNGGDYNQADYDGSISEYTISQNDDGSISVAHPTLGTDTLTDIDGFWFGGDGQWYSLVDALASSSNVIATGVDAGKMTIALELSSQLNLDLSEADKSQFADLGMDLGASIDMGELALHEAFDGDFLI